MGTKRILDGSRVQESMLLSMIALSKTLKEALNTSSEYVQRLSQSLHHGQMKPTLFLFDNNSNHQASLFQVISSATALLSEPLTILMSGFKLLVNQLQA